MTMLLPGGLAAQDRGLVVAARAVGGADLRIGRQYAVLIAIDRYREWTPLRHPVADARAVKDILARRYYIDEFIELYDADATAVGIRRLFADLIDRTGPSDSVLIYYAGHGYTDRFQTGFWIPVDGSKDVEAQDRWIPNQQIRNFVTQMKARSVALFADSCFSGDLLNVHRGAAPALDSEYFRNALRYNARQVLTSGASETVPDESEFARQFRTFLESNHEPYVDPYAMYDRVRRGVTQTLPLFGTLPGQEQGGSFVLFLRDAPVAGASGAASAAGAALAAGARITQTGDAELMVALAGASAADVYVNGSLVGKAPGLLQRLPSGVPLVVEARAGFDAARLELTLQPRELREVRLQLQRMTGNLFIESSEAAVEVWLDGTRLGPLGSGLFRDLTAGERSLELKGRDLYYKGSITIPGNETARISVRVAGIGSIQIDAPATVTISLSGPGGLTRSQRGPGRLELLPEGNYQLSASGSGFQPASTSLSLRRGQTASWTPYTTGSLQWRTEPVSATLLVNGQAQPAGVSIVHLPPGTHRLSFRAPGYHEKQETVTIEAGRGSSLNVRLNELARASLSIEKPPFGISVALAAVGMTAATRVTSDSSASSPALAAATLRIPDIQAGIAQQLVVSVPFADSLDPPTLFNRTITLDEGARQSITLPSGQFSLPWLPPGASLVFAPATGQTTAIPLQPDGQGWRSPPLATGSYTVRLTGSHEYRGQVTIQDGKIIELPGYRETLGKAIGNDILAAQRQLQARAGRRSAGWISLVTGLAGSGAAAAAYYLGGVAWQDYQSAQATSDVLAAKEQLELWGTVLPAAATIGGLGLGLAPILWSAGPDPKALERSIAASEESLKKLRGE
jgi:hypothetical protein